MAYQKQVPTVPTIIVPEATMLKTKPFDLVFTTFLNTVFTVQVLVVAVLHIIYEI